MWGNAKEAIEVSSSSSVSSVLISSTGAAHIPLQDSRWQELLHQYETLVHLEKDKSMKNEIIETACANTVKHAADSSNLAALTLHVSRMLLDLQSSIASKKGSDNVSSKIVLVGKARATCGALNWLRILCHSVIVQHAQHNNNESSNINDCLEEVFTYKPRPSSASSPAVTTLDAPSTPSSIASSSSSSSRRSTKKRYKLKQRNAALELLNALLTFLSSLASHASNTSLSSSSSKPPDILEIPELYDAAVLSTSLLLVLLSTQLYNDMISSLQLQSIQQQQQDDHQSNNNYFLNLIMMEAQKRRNQILKFRKKYNNSILLDGNNNDGGVDEAVQGYVPSSSSKGKGGEINYATTILSTTLNFIVSRPKPPIRSITAYKSTVTQSIAHLLAKQKHFVLSKDGMYECYDIVLSTKPDLKKGKKENHLNKNDIALEQQQQKAKSADDHGSTKESPSSPLDVMGGDGQPLAAPSSSLSTTQTSSSLVITTSSSPHHNATAFMKTATQNVLHLSSTILLLPIRLMYLAFHIWGRNSLGVHSRYPPSSFMLSRGQQTQHQPRTAEEEYQLLRFQKLQQSSSDTIQQQKQYTRDVLYVTDSPLADLSSCLFLLLTNNNRYSISPSSSLSSSSSNETKEEIINPFREELETLNDNRWEGRTGTTPTVQMSSTIPNFESLSFETANDDDCNNKDKNGTDGSILTSSQQSSQLQQQQLLSINFECLFESFGKTLHTELSSLVLYTILQSSPIFAASVAVRSDLDTLVLPLLRTLYFSSAIVVAPPPPSSSGKKDASLQQQHQNNNIHHQHPFRTQSQIYLLLILLLLFTQDPSFGPDSFRRITLNTIPWYKERSLKSISLGSILILTCLRSLTYNLNRSQDIFWLSNVHAVLLNISPHVCDLHEYASMRLVSVAVGCMKRFRAMIVKEKEDRGGGEGGNCFYNVPEEGDLESVVGMYGETCRTLLQLLKHSVRPKVVESNIHVVYALAYCQTDFYNAIAPFEKRQEDDEGEERGTYLYDDGGNNGGVAITVGAGSSSSGGLGGQASPFQSSELGVLPLIISKADSIIRKDHQTRTATEAMEILKQSASELKNIRLPRTTSSSPMEGRSAAASAAAAAIQQPLLEAPFIRDRIDSFDSVSTAGSEAGDFAFTYEEEVDPEVFFVPYVWDVIVSVATSSSMAGMAEWDRSKIRVFPLLDGGDDDVDEGGEDGVAALGEGRGNEGDENGGEGVSMTNTTSGTYGTNMMDVV